MPELPDVEVFRRYFDATSLNQKVQQVEVLDERILEDTTQRKLRRALSDQRFTSTKRHGKFMFAATDGDDWLVLHFGMTGYLSYHKDGGEIPGHTRVVFSFDNGHRLALIDQRILGLAGVTQEPDAFIEDRKLGPDAFAIEREQFGEVLGGGRGTVKSALTNQGILAGIGNIYADEILFQSRIHPKTQMSSLADQDLNALYEQTRVVCEKAIDAGVDVDRMPDSFLLRHRQEGTECPRCGTPIDTLKVSSRTAFYCPTCQQEG